jgi:hypothetical protein
VRRGDLALFGKVLRETLWRGGPRRAWFTLRLLAAVAWRRPSVFKEAVSFALVHKAFADYVDALGRRLDQAIEEMATSGGSEPGAALERG